MQVLPSTLLCGDMMILLAAALFFSKSIPSTASRARPWATASTEPRAGRHGRRSRRPVSYPVYAGALAQ